MSMVHVSALTCVDLQNNLIKGKETSEVLSLQNFLAQKGFLTAKPNGYFGVGTLAAVKKYQQSIGLSRSGQVFPLTRAAIKKETCGSSASLPVSNTGTQNTSTVSTVDITPTLAGTYAVGINPYGIAITPSTNIVWVANYSANNLSKINLTTGDNIGTYSTGINPVQLITEPFTNSLWVANRGSNSVTKINLATETTIGTYPVGVNPGYLAFDAYTKSIWVANRGSNTVTKINASDGVIMGTYSVGSNPVVVEFDSFTNSIWVANNSSSSIMKLNPTTGAIIGTYTVGNYPSGIAFDSYTNSLWVTSYTSNNVTKINPTTGVVIGTYTVGTNPTGVTFDTYTKSVWVANRGSNNVIKINPVTGATLGTYSVGTNPNSIAVTSNAVWVSNYTTNNVTKFTTQKSVTTTTQQVATTTPTVTLPVVLTPNQQRQQDVSSILTAMYNYYVDNYNTYVVTLGTTTPRELCAQGISMCDSLFEVKTALVPRFLSRMPIDPSLTNATGTGYFFVRSTNGDITITAPRATSSILATCNFNTKCQIATATSTNTSQTKPQITKIDGITLISGGSMTVPIVISGSGFGTATNTVLLTLQNSQRVYTIGNVISATGTILKVNPDFTTKNTYCGPYCSEIPAVGTYALTVKNQGGESNPIYISLGGALTQTTPNSPNTSFIPKSTHAKLATFTISSSVGAKLKTLAITVTASSSALASKVSSFTLTDVLADKVINGGPTFTFTDLFLTTSIL